MKNLLLSSAALLSLTAGALAADFPARTVAPAPAPLVAPVFTWTGSYIGVSGGYLRHITDLDVTQTFPPATVGANDVESDGFLIGGTAGANVQFGMVVAGFEVDLSYADVSGDNSITNPAGTRRFTASSDMEVFGTVRGRLGVAFDRFMLYGTGGLAVANMEVSGTITNPLNANFPVQSGETQFNWETGWTAGAGGEWAFTNNLTVKVEWLHYKLEDVDLIVSSNAGSFVETNVAREGDLVRGGVNYKF